MLWHFLPLSGRAKHVSFVARPLPPPLNHRPCAMGNATAASFVAVAVAVINCRMNEVSCSRGYPPPNTGRVNTRTARHGALKQMPNSTSHSRYYSQKYAMNFQFVSLSLHLAFPLFSGRQRDARGSVTFKIVPSYRSAPPPCEVSKKRKKIRKIVA